MTEPPFEDPDVLAGRAALRKLAKARREVRKSVERFAGISDPLAGHRAEALRLARQVRDAADEAVRAFDAER